MSPDDKIVIEIDREEIKKRESNEKLNFLIDSAFLQQQKLDKLNGIPERILVAEKNITNLWGYIKIIFIGMFGGLAGLFWKKGG